MRLSPASWAAAEKLSNDRATPGSPSEVMSNRTASVPNAAASTAAAAPLNELCPDVYDGNGGVSRSGCQSGSGVTSGSPSRPAARTAVAGRQKSNRYLQSQQAIATSASATLSAA